MKKKYLIEEINRNELMCKKYRKICTTLNYIEYCVSICTFASLVGIPIGITSSAVG